MRTILAEQERRVYAAAADAVWRIGPAVGVKWIVNSVYVSCVGRPTQITVYIENVDGSQGARLMPFFPNSSQIDYPNVITFNPPAEISYGQMLIIQIYGPAAPDALVFDLSGWQEVVAS